QIAEQIAQALVGPISPAEPLDPLSQSVALLLRDQRQGRPPIEAPVVADADMVPKESERLRHRGDERLRLRELQSHLLFQECCHRSLLFLRDLPCPFVLLGAGGAPTRRRKSSAYRMGITLVLPGCWAVLRASI